MVERLYAHEYTSSDNTRPTREMPRAIPQSCQLEGSADGVFVDFCSVSITCPCDKVDHTTSSCAPSRSACSCPVTSGRIFGSIFSVKTGTGCDGTTNS